LAERQDVWEYPLKALREAIANTICHRSYASNATTMIRLYDDHLTISNPGHLAYQLHAEDLLREHESYPTNKLIAESFYNVGIIEHWGTGTILIANALKAQEQPPPEFDVSSPHTFKVKLVAAEQRTQPVRESKLNVRQMQAIEYLGSHAQITSAKYQELFGASKATATRDLSNLARKGILVQMGTGSGIAYRLANRTTPPI
jgi:ATP-dependent DNA helicase RecG